MCLTAMCECMAVTKVRMINKCSFKFTNLVSLTWSLFQLIEFTSYLLCAKLIKITISKNSRPWITDAIENFTFALKFEGLVTTPFSDYKKSFY